MPQPKLTDVAAAAGVSPTTVSRVLNDRGYLSQRTKDAVHAAMQELGYRPNAIARSLQNRSSRLVGIIFPTVAHPFYGQMAATLETALAEQDFKTLLCDSAGHPDRERRQMDMLLANQVDGIITGAHSQVMRDYPGLRAPVVTIDRPHGHDFPNISCGNRSSTREVTLGLIARGARRPAHLTASEDPENPRLLGYLEAMAQQQLPPMVLRARSSGWPPEEGAVSTLLDEQLLGGAPSSAGSRGQGTRAETEHTRAELPADALVTGNDQLAAASVHWARTRGVSVPEDLQIVGFDGSSAVQALCPGLSTVVQPYEEMAQAAVGAVIEALTGSPRAGGTVELPARVLWRETTRA